MEGDDRWQAVSRNPLPFWIWASQRACWAVSALRFCSWGVSPAEASEIAAPTTPSPAGRAVRGSCRALPARFTGTAMLGLAAQSTGM